MASKQSSTSASDFRAGESRALPFEIDLNEIPSSPSNEPPPSSPSPASTAYEAVRTFLGTPRPAPGPPADLPTEVRNSSCICGRSDARGATIICDACERWFHLSCAGLRSRQAISLDDWICAPCIKGGVASKRWPVGGVCSGSRGTGVRLLDINALPLSDGEGESIEDLHSHRMHSVDEKSLRGDALNASVAYTNLRNARNGFDIQGGFGMSDHLTRSISEGSAQHKLTTKRSFEETDPSAHFRGRYRGTNSNTSYRRKEPARFSRANNPTVNRVLSSGCGGVLSSDMEILEPATCNTGINARVAEVGVDGNSGFEPKQLNDGFPIQYEDFFILHLGEIDMRPSYHISSQIWPVGYRSSWHDKITGSLFTCYVLDGGSSGPIFKVKRCPCSKSLIPTGSTIFSKVAVVEIDATDDVGIDAAINSDICFEEDDVIQMYLSVPDPSGQDMLSCLGGGLNEAPALQTVNALPSQSASLPKKSVTRLPENDVLRDEIGEFFVEGRSSSLVWTKVSETLVDACREVYKQSGVTRFFCKHELDGSASAGVKAEHAFSSLAKFCNLSAPVKTPLVICSVNELDAYCEALSKWLSQDRFGLDVDFVQEIIEQLPGAHACPGYELLNKRKDYSTSVTLGSGLLMIRRKNGVIAEKDEILNDLLKGCKNSMKQGSVQIHKMGGHHPSLGRPLCSTLSAELSSDVLQVWEFLWRFSEILNLNEIVQLEELETELVDPWFDDSNFLEKIEKEIQENGNHTSLGDDNTIGNILSPVGGSDPVIPLEGVPQFIKVETLSGKEASLGSRTYHRCTGAILTKIHSSLLKVLVSELQAKVAALVDPTFDTGESKPRRGRRKDVDNSVAMKISKVELLPINEFTWPEMARRYILAVLSMDGNLDSSEITSREGGKVFRCLQGDGGVICGSLTGVAGMEADALLLAEASKQVYGSLKRENDVWPVEDKESDANGACETNGVGGGDVPEWAQVLEPVRKLPTNVGTRIRKCVYDALDRGPPEWAKKILEHSISKEVYKGNASGPTKKAVISVLTEVYGEGPQQKLVKERKAKSTITKSDIIMKQCRFVLRRAAAADEAKTFCNLLGTTYLNPNENDDEGFLGSPAMVSRPLDFRTVDLRLAAGAYGGSHEAFLEDVREVWYNIRIAYGDQPELMQLAETLSENFESLYEKEVLTLVQKFREHASLESSSSEPKKELIDPLVCANDVPKAPWDEGVCKVCGIDRDDESVLLCDTCDSEYHTYCLVPPLARIPDGNWYCPSCVAGQGKAPNATTCTRVMNRRRPKRYQGERSRLISETVNHLAVTMREKEYWEFSVDERVFLLKFLCDEVLNSAILREHLDQCADMSSDLQQRLRSLQVELKNLKFKEETLAARATKESVVNFNEVGEAGRDRVTTVLSNHGKWTEQRQTMNNKSTYHMASTDTLFQLEDVPEDSKHPCGFYSKSISERHCNGSRTEQMEVSNAGNQIKDVHSVTDGGLALENIFTRMASTTHESNRQNDQPLSTEQIFFDESVNRKLAFGTENNGSALDPEFHGSYLPLGTGRTLLTDHVSIMPTDLDKMLLGHHSVQPDANEPHDAHNLEANSLKKEILLLQDTITSTELQLLKVSMRREFLGRDSFGRLYWVLSRPGKRPWLIVDRSMPSETESRESAASVANENHPHNCLPHVRDSPSCTFYDSDCEIRQIVECLVDSDAREKELKESILQRWRPQESLQVRNHVQIDSQGTPSKSLVSETTAAPSSLFTKAATILQKRYGPWLESESIDIPKKRGRKAKITHEDRMHRCECLELVWPSRQHCFSCHQTFPTSVELEGHNDGKCNSGPSDDSKENAEPLKGKGLIRSEASQEEHIDGVFKSEKFDVCSRLAKFLKNAPVCPYNFEEISRKFITKDSNKELVKEIGLLGSNGIPMLIPSSCLYIDDPTLILDSAQKAKAEGGAHPTTREAIASRGVGAEFNLNCSDTIDYSLGRSDTIGTKELLKTEVTKLDCVGANDPVASLNDTSPDLDAGDGDIVPDSSLRPLVGKDFEILRRLKINLLDMDAALPEEALRPTKAQSARRCAWRAFVKSADTILEMVKAAIVFEDMIKTKYLRNGWWYWSSLSTAARISTLSSLAFRVYALDASIIYENASPVLDGNHSMDNPKSGKKRKESEG